jgi:glycosidase
MTGGEDPDNRHDFPGGFPGDRQNAFLESGRTRPQQELFSHVRMLLRLRKDHAALRDGELWDIQWDRSSYTYARVTKQERILVAFNAGSTEKQLHITFAGTPLDMATDLVSLTGNQTGTHNIRIEMNHADLNIAPNELQIFLAQ